MTEVKYNPPRRMENDKELKEQIEKMVLKKKILKTKVAVFSNGAKVAFAEENTIIFDKENLDLYPDKFDTLVPTGIANEWRAIRGEYNG